MEKNFAVSKKSTIFAENLAKGIRIMTTYTLDVPRNQTRKFRSMARAMGWDVKVAARRKHTNTCNVTARMLARLEVFKNQVEGWDGRDALPLEKDSYANAKTAISNAIERDLRGWILFPNTNGTLLFTLKGDNVASISLGNKGFSFVAIPRDSDIIQGESTFSTESFLTCIRNINRLMNHE